MPHQFLIYLTGQLAFAAPPGQPFEDLQAQIDDLSETVEQLQADLEAKDMALMDKDMELMDDLSDLDTETTANFQAVGNALKGDETVCDESFEGDNTLCQRAEEFAGNYELLCNNVPFFRDAIGIVNTSVVAVLGGINSAIGGINGVFTTLHDRTFNVSINPPTFGVNPPSKCISIPIPAAPDPEVCVNIPNFGVNPPAFGANFGQLLSFLPTDPIPSIPTNVIGNVGTTLDEVGECTIV